MKRNKYPLMAIILLSLVCGLSLEGCSDSTPYDERKSLGGGEWSKDVPCVFTIDSLPGGRDENYSVTLTLRCKESFAYDTLWVAVSGASLDREFRKDTIALPLTDKNGKWVSRGPRKGIVESSVRLPLAMKAGEIWEMEVEHCMPKDTLLSVLDIGIRLDKKE